MKKSTKRLTAFLLVSAMTTSFAFNALASSVVEAGQEQQETGGPGGTSGSSTPDTVEGNTAPGEVSTPPETETTPETTETPQMTDYPVISGAPAEHAVANAVTIETIYGSSGQIQNISMKLNGISGAISYGVYVNNGGYLPWLGNGYPSGGVEDSTHIEAIQVAITGEAASLYNVYYRGVSLKAGQHGWASAEELMGTMDRGDYLTDIEVVLVPKAYGAPGTYEGRFYSSYSEYIRINADGAALKNADGTAHNGWADHDRARYYFVDGQAVTGWHYIDGFKYYFNERGALIMDVEPYIGTQASYQLRVNKTLNCLTVYAKDGDNGYTIPVKSMLTSVGDDTPLGTFKTPEKYRWRLMVNDTYTQYATRITAGFLFHSITYEKADENTLITDGYNKLGINRSLGCIRLNCWNSKWVYDNCKLGTEVVIYEDAATPGPFFKPYLVWIAEDQTYDPTDPKFIGQ
ncbi:MAG: L,D-transpeptidase family protein [Lachnospiraceae bacterium]